MYGKLPAFGDVAGASPDGHYACYGINMKKPSKPILMGMALLTGFSVAACGVYGSPLASESSGIESTSGTDDPESDSTSTPAESESSSSSEPETVYGPPPTEYQEEPQDVYGPPPTEYQEEPQDVYGPPPTEYQEEPEYVYGPPPV